jgi:hypothetical protein
MVWAMPRLLKHPPPSPVIVGLSLILLPCLDVGQKYATTLTVDLADLAALGLFSLLGMSVIAGYSNRLMTGRRRQTGAYRAPGIACEDDRTSIPRGR